MRLFLSQRRDEPDNKARHKITAVRMQVKIAFSHESRNYVAVCVAVDTAIPTVVFSSRLRS
jgi:hypothetical protein